MPATLAATARFTSKKIGYAGDGTSQACSGTAEDRSGAVAGTFSNEVLSRSARRGSPLRSRQNRNSRGRDGRESAWQETILPGVFISGQENQPGKISRGKSVRQVPVVELAVRGLEFQL